MYTTRLSDFTGTILYLHFVYFLQDSMKISVGHMDDKAYDYIHVKYVSLRSLEVGRILNYIYLDLFNVYTNLEIHHQRIKLIPYTNY